MYLEKPFAIAPGAPVRVFPLVNDHDSQPCPHERLQLFAALLLFNLT